MNRGELRRGLVMAGLLTLAATVTGGEAPYRRAAVPADGKITLTDWGRRDWGPELVHYAVDTERFKPGKLALLDAQGRAVPFQIEGDTLSFVASLPKGESVTYTLQSSEKDRSAENSTLQVTRDAKGLELANAFLGLRLPPEEERKLAAPLEAAQVTPPLLQWKTTGQDWVGGARFATPRKVASCAFKLLHHGPAYAEYEARYGFAPKGEYVMRVRLAGGMPIAVVTEEFDMGEVTQGDDFLVLELHKGWQPQNIAWVSGAGEQLMPGLEPAATAAYLEAKKKAKAQGPQVGGVGQAPTVPPPEAGLVPLERIVPAGKWGGLKGGVQVWDGGGSSAKPGEGRSLAWTALSAGSWRRAMAVPVWHKDGTGLLVGLPLSVRPLRWSLETTDDFSPFSTHEHDSGLSATYGRRVWGFLAGPGLELAQPRFGYIGLDRYKDWIVDWPEGDAAKKAYPGGWFKSEHVARVRQALDQHPAAEILRNRYLISGKAEDAVKNAQTVIAKLKNPYQENDFFLHGLSNYRKAQLLVFANEAEDALACPGLPGELRRELRRWLALYAYVTSDPDFNPRGAGVHLGNNNMPINRTCSLAYFAGLLPDHPCGRYWMDCVKEFVRFKLASQFSLTGESLECPCYQLYAPAGGLNIAQNVLRNRGVADFVKDGVLRRNLVYLANLTMPDPRWGGARIIPGMGNSGNLQDSIWGVSVATFLDQDAAFAGWCKAMFQAAGAKFGQLSTGVTFVGHPMYYLPDAAETPLKLTSTFMPAYGVAFRAHAGTPNETALLLRAGTNWGHWDTDALNVILYGKGAPLSPGTGYQYYAGVATQNNMVYHNQVKVAQRDLQEVFGRVDGAIQDYGFGSSADYAVAERYYPPEIFADKKGEMRWRRHVLFLKSDKAEGPSYFVMRDTFPGGEDRTKWWTWLNLDLPDRISVDGKAFEKGKVPVEKVLAESARPALKGQVIEMATSFGASTWFWFTEPREARVRGVMQYPGSGGQETKTILEVLAGPKQDYLYVAFPRKNGEGTPDCVAAAEGVLKIKTAEATDYAFVADAPVKFEKEDVLFEGQAGCVRVFADRVALCLFSGSGRVGYKGMIFEGPGPFEKLVALKDLKAGVQKVEGGYEKKTETVDLGNGIVARGEGPFEAKLDGETIRIKTKGRARVLYVTQPRFIVRPQLWVDGQECMASWTDYPASGWGTYKNTWLMALATPEGEHELVVKDFVFPPVWARPFEPLIPNAVKEAR